MKKAIYAALLLIIAVALAACSGKREEVPVEEVVEEELKGEITVSCYDSTPLYQGYLNEAAALFELEHPGAKINIETFSRIPGIRDEEDYNKEEQAVMDYILRINTQLMSDTGPDILAMDVLPYYKYAASGMLEDLRAYMDTDPDFDINDYRYNIMEGVRYNGGQYMMPLAFGYDFVTFDSNKVGGATAVKLREKNIFTYAELIGLIEEKFVADESDARVIDIYNGAWEAFRVLFNKEFNKFVDLENKKANFSDGSFVKLLNDLNEQRQNGFFKPEFTSWEESYQDTFENQDRYYYHYEGDCSTLKLIFTPKENRNPNMTKLIPEIDEVAGLLANDAGQVAFWRYNAYSMNSYSHNKALAWAFIKFMLSEEMQQAFNLIGLPVNNAAFIEDSKVDMIKTQIDAIKLDGGGWAVTGYEERTDEKYLRAYDDFMEYHNKFVSALNYYPITDRIITLMVYNEVKLFFDGSKSAEMVASYLQNKINLYLNE